MKSLQTDQIDYISKIEAGRNEMTNYRKVTKNLYGKQWQRKKSKEMCNESLYRGGVESVGQKQLKTKNIEYDAKTGYKKKKKN